MTHLTLANSNVRLAASVDGPIDAVPILLLHGASVSRDTWDDTKQQLMDRYCVWTLDFRGHGHSDRAPNYNLAGYVSDAETALAAIGRPAIVVGHSLGACVAGALSQANPNVRAVFLEDPPWFLESVQEHQAGLQSFRSMRRIEARRKNARPLRLRFSQSLASLRQRLSQAMVRSTIQRLGSTMNPLA